MISFKHCEVSTRWYKVEFLSAPFDSVSLDGHSNVILIIIILKAVIEVCMARKPIIFQTLDRASPTQDLVLYAKFYVVPRGYRPSGNLHVHQRLFTALHSSVRKKSCHKLFMPAELVLVFVDGRENSENNEPWQTLQRFLFCFTHDTAGREYREHDTGVH